MAKKLAVFVEGLTERIFLAWLLKEVAGHKNIDILNIVLAGKSPGRERFVQIHARARATEVQYFALIVQSSQDDRVVSDIRDNYAGLVREGYHDIIGVRDVYPNRRGEISAMESLMREALTTSPIDPLIILAVMEVEAWFWAEHTHFEQLDARLTYAAIEAATGSDPRNIDPENELDHPSLQLDRAYRVAKKRYRKHRNLINRTVFNLDIARMYLELRERPVRLAQLLDRLDSFFQ